jgi:hypothetical protein
MHSQFGVRKTVQPDSSRQTKQQAADSPLTCSDRCQSSMCSFQRTVEQAGDTMLLCQQLTSAQMQQRRCARSCLSGTANSSTQREAGSGAGALVCSNLPSESTENHTSSTLLIRAEMANMTHPDPAPLCHYRLKARASQHLQSIFSGQSAGQQKRRVRRLAQAGWLSFLL